ncbi:hypothetical protein VP01_2082g3 [Puccinia sorghi]|uniref:Uncharacterized protein n=1 Tax=Puccinia sorghi TaxID=27349 RepID=A0A0L6VB01_9BASI|nr:hypothetical protein VP01_2082g3 [Puccinia sorghi]
MGLKCHLKDHGKEITPKKVAKKKRTKVSQWYKDHSYIDNIFSALNSIKFEFSRPCRVGNWISMPTAVDLVCNNFKPPVIFWLMILP